MSGNRNPWAALLVLCLGFFVILLDTTIVNVAMPTMITSLHASLDQILWVLNAYLLTLAVLIVTSGRLGDILGQRRMFVAGLALFTAASAACGLSQDANQLILARTVQGIAAAILSPQALAIISVIFPAERRGAALGIMAGVTALAAVGGPIAGGLIVTYLDWRWIFFVNLPIGVAGIALALWLVPGIRTGRGHSLDLPGVALATAGLLAIVFGLVEGQRYSWSTIGATPFSIPEVIAAGAVILAAFVLWERSRPEPLLPLQLFQNRDFSVATLLTALQFFGMFGFFITTTIYLQSVLGMSAIQAGLTTLPVSLGIMAVSPLAGRLTDRIGGRYILMAGSLLFGVGIGGVALVASVSAGSLTFVLPLAIAGVGSGLMIAPIMTVAMHRVQPAMAGAASATLNTSRQIGAAVGAAVVGAVMQNQLLAAMHDRAVADSGQLPAGLRAQFVSGVSGAASNGFEVGRGQSGGIALPAGLPPQLGHQLQLLIHDVFVNGYVSAMRPTLLVPVLGFALGAAACTFIGRRTAADVVATPVVELPVKLAS